LTDLNADTRIRLKAPRTLFNDPSADRVSEPELPSAVSPRAAVFVRRRPRPSRDGDIASRAFAATNSLRVRVLRDARARESSIRLLFRVWVYVTVTIDKLQQTCISPTAIFFVVPNVRLL